MPTAWQLECRTARALEDVLVTPPTVMTPLVKTFPPTVMTPLVKISLNLKDAQYPVDPPDLRSLPGLRRRPLRLLPLCL